MKQPAILLALVVLIPLSACSSTTTHAQQQRQNPHITASSHPATTIATQMVGKPYRFGGASPKGFDCSGLVYYSFGKAGYKVPRTSEQQYQVSLPVKRSHLQEGDLLFFRIEGKISHVGVYLDDNQFVHAPSSGKEVSIGSLDNPYWKERFVKAGRIF